MQKSALHRYRAEVRPCADDPRRFRFILVSEDETHTIETDNSFTSEKVARDVGAIRARDVNAEAERKARSLFDRRQVRSVFTLPERR